MGITHHSYHVKDLKIVLLLEAIWPYDITHHKNTHVIVAIWLTIVP